MATKQVAIPINSVDIEPSNENGIQTCEQPNDKETDENKEIKAESRNQWGNKFEFILASVGLAVGLGNIWRFPYLAQKNGGGAFLIPYFIFMVIEGLPLFFIEYAVGQRFRASSVTAWSRISPALRGIGWSCVMVSVFLCIYYIVVLAWCIHYFLMSFTSELPWQLKQACVNNPQFRIILRNIVKYKNNATLLANWTQARDNFPDCCVRDPAQWYFYQKVLRISSDIEDTGIGINVNLVGCLILAWIITYLCIAKSVQSSGKVVYFTAIFPYIVLIILFFRGVSLENAGEGIKTFFEPDFSKLSDPKIWLDAAAQIFFTLSLGFGALIAFASYMPVKNNCTKDAYTVVFINCGTSLFAGIVVFSILGYRELKTGLPAAEAGSGPGLVFMTFSDAILLMDGAPFWAIMFFIMLALLGIDSEFGTLEAAIAPFYDSGLVKNMRREVFTGLVAFTMFLIGLFMVSGNGFYIFQIFDDYSVSLQLLFIAFFQCIAVTWVYGSENFANDIEYMTGSRPNIFWLVCWKYISPIALLAVFTANVYSMSQGTFQYAIYTGCELDPHSYEYQGSKGWLSKVDYPVWGQVVVVCIICIPFLPILYFLFLDLYQRPQSWVKGFKKRLFTSWVEYLPDPARFDRTRHKTEGQMKQLFQRYLDANELDKNK